MFVRGGQLWSVSEGQSGRAAGRVVTGISNISINNRCGMLLVGWLGCW